MALRVGGHSCTAYILIVRDCARSKGHACGVATLSTATQMSFLFLSIDYEVSLGQAYWGKLCWCNLVLDAAGVYRTGENRACHRSG